MPNSFSLITNQNSFIFLSKEDGFPPLLLHIITHFLEKLQRLNKFMMNLKPFNNSTIKLFSKVFLLILEVPRVKMFRLPITLKATRAEVQCIW